MWQYFYSASSQYIVLPSTDDFTKRAEICKYNVKFRYNDNLYLLLIIMTKSTRKA